MNQYEEAARSLRGEFGLQESTAAKLMSSLSLRLRWTRNDLSGAHRYKLLGILILEFNEKFYTSLFVPGTLVPRD